MGSRARKDLPRSSSIGAPHADQIGRPQYAAVCAESDCLGDVVSCPDTPASDEGDLVANPFLLQEFVDLWYGQLNRHGDVLLGYLRCRSSAAIAAVEVDDMRTCVVRADCDHVYVVRSADLDREYRLRIDSLYPIEML